MGESESKGMSKTTYTKADFARWGAIGGSISRRKLTPETARAMVESREAKKAEKKRIDSLGNKPGASDSQHSS